MTPEELYLDLLKKCLTRVAFRAPNSLLGDLIETGVWRGGNIQIDGSGVYWQKQS